MAGVSKVKVDSIAHDVDQQWVARQLEYATAAKQRFILGEIVSAETIEMPKGITARARCVRSRRRKPHCD